MLPTTTKALPTTKMTPASQLDDPTLDGPAEPPGSAGPSNPLPDVLALLDGLKHDPAMPHTFPVSETILSLPSLFADMRGRHDRNHIARVIKALPDAATGTLVVGLATTTEPITLWAIHCELDRRNVPPCIRWPANNDSPQTGYITFLADMLWFCKRHPGHTLEFRGWRGLFTNAPASPAWHATAHRQYLYVWSRYSLSYYAAKGLMLSDADRIDLMTLPTKTMVAERRQLQPTEFSAIRVKLLSHSAEHPDRSGVRSFEDVANRRAGLWRLFLLSGKSQANTVRNWKLLMGETITRQAVAKQLSIVASVLE